MTSAATLGAVGRGSSARRPEDVLAADVVSVLRPDGTVGGQEPELTDGDVVELYRAMVRSRLFDERAVMLQRQGRIGFHIGSIGEEATVIGSAFALRKQDWIFPCYREFGAALWRGMPAQRYWDNLYGNANDLAKGRQMPDHWCCKSAQLASVSSPIGTQITNAVGFAWAAKLRKDPVAVLVYFGDGATSSGEFHNGINFAGVYKTPAIFVCRNNGWAISVPTERQTASETFAGKGIAYGVPGVRCDGNDLLAVIQVTRDAVARAARGEGPTLIEALTYRLSGHSTSDDPKRYRAEEEVDAWEKLDPNLRMRAYLKERVGWNDGDQRELDETVAAELKELIATAESTAAPALESMFDDVFEELPWHLREQREELLRGPRAKGH
jgi:2-oxoisovalerate dehydrogenase E1 component alpha subunit